MWPLLHLFQCRHVLEDSCTKRHEIDRSVPHQGKGVGCKERRASCGNAEMYGVEEMQKRWRKVCKGEAAMGEYLLAPPTALYLRTAVPRSRRRLPPSSWSSEPCFCGGAKGRCSARTHAYLCVRASKQHLAARFHFGDAAASSSPPIPRCRKVHSGAGSLASHWWRCVQALAAGSRVSKTTQEKGKIRGEALKVSGAVHLWVLPSSQRAAAQPATACMTPPPCAAAPHLPATAAESML